ncbi:MAG: RnfABCDGE type electron transport complex subunit B [Deltaproteobacteria bacterium]|nr:RnfABCDGE type electron transport complex subunit B [Deltaproteobacteria bacterium]
MLSAFIVLFSVGLVMAALLTVGKKVFEIEKNEKLEALIDIMPGANCGGCGYPGCSGYASALCEGRAKPNLCPPGGANLVQAIGEVLGIEVEAGEKMVALVACAGGDEESPLRNEYSGISDCRAAHALNGGPKSCTFGCLGMGSCITACAFDAINKTSNGLVVVDNEKCTGCKACVEACPRDVIKMVPYSATVHVLCNNPQKAKAVKAVCTVGCTGCKICTKQSKALVVDDALAVVDHSNNIEISAETALSCPQGSIFDGRKYSIVGWVEEKKTREDFEKRSIEFKEEDKKRKAEARAKAKEKADAAQKEGDKQ